MASVFITVGTTSFNELVNAATSLSFVSTLVSLGYCSLLIQYGSGEPIYMHNLAKLQDAQLDITVSGYAYKPSINDDMAAADLVISHAGAGSILQALRLQKRLIVVSNSGLMDNHQSELAQAMKEKNYCECSTISALEDALRRMNAQRQMAEFPKAATDTFAKLIDDHMGFA
ncbi:putative glycosyltransferase [Dichotomocladium elegans]|nr:putative glycosyltransferase [Dichotomocladium elegans]